VLYLVHQQDFLSGGRYPQWARGFERYCLGYEYVSHWTDLVDGHLKTLFLEQTSVCAQRVEAAVGIFDWVQRRMSPDGVNSVLDSLQ
jgi:hypothetical protein